MDDDANRLLSEIRDTLREHLKLVERNLERGERAREEAQKLQAQVAHDRQESLRLQREANERQQEFVRRQEIGHRRARTLTVGVVVLLAGMFLVQWASRSTNLIPATMYAVPSYPYATPMPVPPSVYMPAPSIEGLGEPTWVPDAGDGRPTLAEPLPAMPGPMSPEDGEADQETDPSYRNL